MFVYSFTEAGGRAGYVAVGNAQLPRREAISPFQLIPAYRGPGLRHICGPHTVSDATKTRPGKSAPVVALTDVKKKVQWFL